MKKILLFILLVSNFYLYSAEIDNPAIELYNKGREYLNTGFYILALENFSKAVELNPFYKEALMGIGEVYFYTFQYDSAIQYYNKVVDIDPDFIDIHFKIAQYYEIQNNIDSALAHYQKIVKVDNANLDALQNIAGIQIKKGALNEAEKTLFFIKKIVPSYIWYIYRCGELYEARNKDDLAVAEYKKLLKVDAAVISEVYFKIANIYLKQNNFDEVEKILLKAASGDENTSYKAKSYLTKLYLFKGNYKAAISLWLKDPEDSLNNYHLGFANMKIAESIEDDNQQEKKTAYYEKAMSYFSGALKYDSNDELILEQLAYISEKINKVNSPMRNDLANTYLIFANNYFYYSGKNNLALFMYERAKRLNPQNPQIRFQLAKLYHFFKFDITAEDEIEKAKELDSQSTDISDLMLVIQNINSNDILSKYTFEKSKKRYNISISIQADFDKVKHYDIGNLTKKCLEKMLEFTDKFNIMMIPEQYKTLEGIEKLSKNFNADAMLILNINETENSLMVDMDLYTLSSHNPKSVYSRDSKIQRSRYLKLDKFSLLRKDKDRFYEMINNLYQNIVNSFPASGEIKGVKDKDLLVNLGYRQGLKKGQELIVYSQSVDSETPIGKIKVKDLNEWYSVCEILDNKIMKVLKLLDIVVKTK